MDDGRSTGYYDRSRHNRESPPRDRHRDYRKKGSKRDHNYSSRGNIVVNCLEKHAYHW